MFLYVFGKYKNLVSPHLSHLDAVQGRAEQRRELYMTYCERAAEALT